MRSNLVILFFLPLLYSCGSYGKKQNVIGNAQRKYITIVESINSYNAAYTDDGHILLYTKDSKDSYVIYYAKLDDFAGKHGYDIIKDKVVRVEMNPSLNTLISLISVYGGAFFKVENETGFKTYYFDENMNVKTIEQTICDSILTEKTGKHNEFKRIVALLNVAYKMALSIRDNHARDWDYIVSALEPTQKLLVYDVITSDTIYDTKIKNQILKIKNTEEGLTHFYYILLKRMNNK